MTRRARAAALRRYRAEWRAALARRDYATTRTVLGAALSAVSKEASADLDTETRGLNDLLALERRLQDISDGEAPVRFPPARRAFETPSTRPFRQPWDLAIDTADYRGASRLLRRAIAALSRQMAKRARSQALLIDRLRRLQRTPLQFRALPERCALCGGTKQPGVDSGRLFICIECIEQAYDILADSHRRSER
jgi:hypothetical protein